MVASLVSQAKSYMTTTSTVAQVLREELTGDVGGASGSIDIELRVKTTAAKQSTIAGILPQLENFEFPSGDSLDAIVPRSSRVQLRTTYLTSTMRISRPVLQLEDAPIGNMDASSNAVFVYARQ